MAGALRGLDIEVFDRRVKWGLLAASLATLAVLIAAALGESVYPQWRLTRIAHAEILRGKATDGAGTAIADRFKIDPDQHVLPELRRVDRCVTCHAGMEDPRLRDQGQPFSTHPGDLLATHPPKKFGCTSCHQGQGLATAIPEAHGNVPFWASPMIPMRYAYAGCGSCHVARRVGNLAGLAQGRNLVERYDCLACHRIDSRGGTVRPGQPGGMEGPDLSRVGVRGFDPHWYDKHLEAFRQARDGPWKLSFGPIDPPEREAIEGFLASRIGAPQLAEAQAVFQSLGCRGCHKVGGVGGDEGPDLTREGQKDPGRLDFTHVPGEPTLANWLTAHTHDPARIVPGSKMPAFGLGDPEIEQLTFYMLSLRRGEMPAGYWPQDRIRVERFREREFAADGATLFGTFCVACHGPAGQGRRFPGSQPFPAIANPDFQAVATDHFLQETITKGRPGRRMPAWGEGAGGLRPDEVRTIIGHLRRLGAVKEPRRPDAQRRWVKGDAEAGRRLFASLCAGCHGTQGEGIEGPALNNQVLLAGADDTYLVETIGRGRRGTPMRSYREGSTVNPALSAAEIESIVVYLRGWEGK